MFGLSKLFSFFYNILCDLSFYPSIMSGFLLRASILPLFFLVDILF